MDRRGRSVTRREVLQGGAAIAGLAVAGGLLGACAPAQQAAVPSASLGPPETTTLHLPLIPPCDPWYLFCEPFLREEGFTDLTFGTGSLSAGDADLGILYGNSFVGAIDSGTPLVALAGMHTGCIMVFARPGISTVADLRGKTIGINTRTVQILGKSVLSTEYGFLLSLLTYIGMQPSDVNFVEVGASGNVITPFTDGKVDAIFTGAAGGPLLMADPKNPGQVILDSSKDKPWSQNYCCVLVTSRDWYGAHPVAAKRMTRAILRATDAAKKDLRAAAKSAIDKGIYKATPAVTEQILYDIIKDESFDWREYDPDDTVRFFALRLADAKLVKKTPQQILADGADFTYFRQLRKELRA
jgi:NitT/TauT family transport system substrate-binding protein